MSGVGEQPGGVEDPSVPVELMLVGGAVADPDGLAVGVAGPASEGVLGIGVAAVEGEQHGESGPFESTGVEQPGQEPSRLVDLADAEEGGDADAGVAGPGEPVVPVANPAEVFGERGRRCGDGCPRWRIGQQAQRDQTALRQVKVRQAVVDVVRPATPPLLVGFERLPCRIRVDVRRVVRAGRRPGRR